MLRRLGLECSRNWPHNIVADGRERNLLNEIDVVSGVSGGSFIAAYFGLHGAGHTENLRAALPVPGHTKALRRAVFAPRNWGSLWSDNYARSDLVADWFDREVFNKATFADLVRKRGAGVIINATDLTRGAPFSFIADQFSLICSDLGSVRLARAAVASAAVPVLFSPVHLPQLRRPVRVRSARLGPDRTGDANMTRAAVNAPS